MPHGAADPYLDLVFAIDCTGSMGPYIKQATEKIEEISKKIFESKLLNDPEDLRVGVVAYRDYAPQDFQEFTIRKPRLNFTSKLADIKTYLSQLKALGGGDGPEAVATCFQDIVENMSWKPGAAGAIVLITDAPPHGIPLMRGDGFPQGDPIKDPTGTKTTFGPTDIVKYFDSGNGKGIHVLVAACEPTLSSYQNTALAFYKGLSKKTNGRLVPLASSEVLADSIIVFALETLKLRGVINKLGGSSIVTQNPKFHTLFRAVTGVHPSQAEAEQQLAKLYEEMPDDLEEQSDLIANKKTPEQAISLLRESLKDEKCHSCKTNVSHTFSAEGVHNVDLFMRSTTGTLPGTLKEDRGTRLVGDLSKQTIDIKEAPLSDGQIKRLAHMYTTRFAT